MKKYVIKISLAFVIIAVAIDYLQFTIDYFSEGTVKEITAGMV